jgi:hypothetical protein|tara:strand:+ start:529 stop:777 length:249 start_codon:yes stop_codon:yes gene_type:complete
MNTVIDKDDKIWLMFLDYCRLVDAEATNASLDIYGTEQRSNMALALTQANLTDKLVSKLTALEKQNAAFHKVDRYNQGISNA